jgi:hypothetical protein
MCVLKLIQVYEIMENNAGKRRGCFGIWNVSENLTAV